MSRLIVKNLPLKVTEEQVSKHFSKTGQVTDVKLKYNKDGEFRGFAFIGYDSEEAADRALTEFKKSYFKRNKITVERCQDLDHKLEKLAAENKITNNKENSATNDKKYFKYALKKPAEMTKEKLETLMNNPSFIQYLTLNKKGTADLADTLKKKYGLLEKKEDTDEQDQNNSDEEDPQKDNLALRNISDLEYLECLKKASTSEIKKEKVKKWEKLFTVVVRTKEQNTNKDKKGKTLMKKSVRDFFKPLKYQSLRIPRGLSYVAYVGFQTEKAMNQALMMDKSFLDGVRVRVHKHEDRNSAKESHLKDAPWKEAEEKLLKEADPIGESGKLFVRNLWYSVKEEDLRKLFEEFGPLANFTLPVSQLTQKAKGFAHVSYTFPEHAVTALNNLDGKSFQGRVLHILPSTAKDENDTDEKNFKNKKKEEVKKNASSWHNWNTLFLASGAVIDLFAQNVNKSKYELFEEKNNESVAVNLALSETLAVEKTKRFLEEEGVSLEAFSNPNVQRSNTIILAKNLPVETTATELKHVFERYGQLGRVVLPPSGVTAIIEFVTASEAKKAFENLAYTRFKWLPLFLEWAPIEIFKTPPPKQEKKEEKNSEDKKSIPEDNTTLYVKNLNFETDEDALREHFSKFGEISSVLIAKKRTLSQGYGFVEFVKTTDADKAMRALQNSSLNGHALTIKKSEKKLTATVKSTRQFHNPGEPTSAKILIKNIPFQATWKEVRLLFQVFGEIKLLRLPKKLGSSEHRGFGFIEFTNEDDAKKAIESLGSSTHLYGRRMVLEWAKEEETVEELRKRTAQKFLNSGPAQKKQKIDVSSQGIDGGDPIDNF